jgi:D-lactate dehydrogenase
LESKIKTYFFDTHSFEKKHFCEANLDAAHEFNFFEGKLTEKSAILAKDYPCVCAFVNDHLDENVLKILAQNGTKLIALRSAGYNHVNLAAAKKLGLKVVRVPEYSPFSVAEHAVALILTLNRKIHKAYNRVREGNFSLEGLVGFDLHGKTVGVIGTGKIGKAFIRIMKGFGCHIVAFDKFPDQQFAKEMGFHYAGLEQVLISSEIISLHIPLSQDTRHMIDQKSLELMKRGVMLINTSRGALIDTMSLISALKLGHVGSAGLDVYEEEENYFFNDLSSQVLEDDVLVRLMTFPNVVLTSHQGFLTSEALTKIAQTTLLNMSQFESNEPLTNEVILV